MRRMFEDFLIGVHMLFKQVDKTISKWDFNLILFSIKRILTFLLISIILALGVLL